MTYGEIYNKFRSHFPELSIEDYRPYNGDNAIYIWLKAPYNIVATYDEADDLFQIKMTREAWSVSAYPPRPHD